MIVSNCSQDSRLKTQDQQRRTGHAWSQVAEQSKAAHQNSYRRNSVRLQSPPEVSFTSTVCEFGNGLVEMTGSKTRSLLRNQRCRSIKRSTGNAGLVTRVQREDRVTGHVKLQSPQSHPTNDRSRLPLPHTISHACTFAMVSLAQSTFGMRVGPTERTWPP